MGYHRPTFHPKTAAVRFDQLKPTITQDGFGVHEFRQGIKYKPTRGISDKSHIVNLPEDGSLVRANAVS